MLGNSGCRAAVQNIHSCLWLGRVRYRQTKSEVHTSPISLLSVHQDASGKMSVGDEIVTIGDTPVCTSTYQDICDLMHNLPITLTLEIKKPVSGKLQLIKMLFVCLLIEMFQKEVDPSKINNYLHNEFSQIVVSKLYDAIKQSNMILLWLRIVVNAVLCIVSCCYRWPHPSLPSRQLCQIHSIII